MSLQFAVIGLSSITDPDTIFEYTGYGSEGNSGDADLGAAARFASRGDAVVQVVDNSVGDSGSNLAAPLSINGVTYAAGSKLEADYEVILQDSSTGHYYRATWLAVDNTYIGVTVSRAWDATNGTYVAGKDGLYTPGTTLTLVSGDGLQSTPNAAQFLTDSNYAGTGDAYGNDATVSESYGAMLCFAEGTQIDTAHGPRDVAALQIGERVLTLDKGPQPILWRGSFTVTARDIARNPKHAPIEIAPQSLGPNCPTDRLRLTRHHRMFLCSPLVGERFGTNGVLVAAKALLALDGVEVGAVKTRLTYHHFALAHHSLVWAEGALAETLYLGGSVVQKMRADLPAASATLARPEVIGRQAHRLIARHKRDGVPVFTPSPPMALRFGLPLEAVLT